VKGYQSSRLSHHLGDCGSEQAEGTICCKSELKLAEGEIENSFSRERGRESPATLNNSSRAIWGIFTFADKGQLTHRSGGGLWGGMIH